MKKNKNDDVEPQSQSIPGPTGDNPNEDVADGNQSSVQPGTGSGNTTGGQSTGDAAVGTNPLPPATGSTPSDGGNAAANQGGTNATSGGDSQ